MSESLKMFGSLNNYSVSNINYIYRNEILNGHSVSHILTNCKLLFQNVVKLLLIDSLI